MRNQDLKPKFLSTILGLAIGDASGYPAEFLSLYCFWKTPEDYVKTVLTGANANGDSDSIACIAGAISGAYNGLGAIPAKWQDRVENKEGLKEIAENLYYVSNKKIYSS